MPADECTVQKFCTIKRIGRLSSGVFGNYDSEFGEPPFHENTTPEEKNRVLTETLLRLTSNLHPGKAIDREPKQTEHASKQLWCQGMQSEKGWPQLHEENPQSSLHRPQTGRYRGRLLLPMWKFVWNSNDSRQNCRQSNYANAATQSDDLAVGFGFNPQAKKNQPAISTVFLPGVSWGVVWAKIPLVESTGLIKLGRVDGVTKVNPHGWLAIIWFTSKNRFGWPILTIIGVST